MIKIKSTLLLLFAAFIAVYSQQFPVKTVLLNGPTNERINIVFLGDGYKSNEMTKYENDVQNTIDKLFEEEPYKDYKNFFNVFAVEVPSNESGTDHPGGLADCGPYKDSVFYRDTYFNSSFDYAGTHRLLVADYTIVQKVLIDNFPEYDMVFMVVNFNWYGGSGGNISVFSTNVSSSEIAIHEAGHSFANLADEYGGNSNGKTDGINVTMQTVKSAIPWKAWIEPDTPLPTPEEQQYQFGTVGLFLGAFYNDVSMYRPQFDCKMRTLNAPFCKICLEQHIKTIFSYFELINSHQPDNENVKMYSNGKTDFNIGIMDFGLSNLSVNWSLDNNTVAQNSYSYSLLGSQTNIGQHYLSATVAYNTPDVINDPQGLLRSTVGWNVEIASPTGIETEDGLPTQYSLDQNYPNPFNPTTEINYQLPAAGHVSLKVYDILGNLVSKLVDEYKQPGYYKVAFNGQQTTANQQLTSGIYFYQLISGNTVITKKMILMK